MTIRDDILKEFGPDPFAELSEEGLVPRRRGRPRKPKTVTTKQATYFTTESKPDDVAPTHELQKPWTGKFIAVDGEGWDGLYTLLQMTGRPDLYNPRGLSSRAIFRYLTDHHMSARNAFVGFGLNYDFEMWLKDVPDEDFLLLLSGEEVDFEGYGLHYIPRKMLSITHTMHDGVERTLTFQDVMGFFQSSFESALKKWNIEVPQIITEFKALRSGFTEDMINKIKLYNRTELAKLVELMEALKASDYDAWLSIGLDPKHSGRIWYGPGSRASNFLKQTAWIDEHPTLRLPNELPDTLKKTLLPRDTVESLAQKMSEEHELIRQARGDILSRVIRAGGLRGLTKGYEHYAEELKTRVSIKVRRKITKKHGLPLDELADELNMTVEDLLRALAVADTDKLSYYDFLEDAEERLLRDGGSELFEHVFAASYYGGRIEAAAQGTFRGTLYDYDITSAYPYAITHLPKWHSSDLLWVNGFDKEHRMGMYFVRWCLPDGVNFYPFPFRAKSGNVFFPREGAGWYMSPEVEAALENWPKGELYDPLSIGMRRAGICVVGGLVLRGTEGAGDGIHFVPDNKRCTTAKKMSEMAAVRVKAKDENKTYEKSLKLLMNSVYGKTIQQVGSHKFLNTFAAAWITSTCRAIISRAIGCDDTENVISIMTDGILTRNPLTVRVQKGELGAFELKTVEGAIQLVPGVYRLDSDLRCEPHIVRYRGVGKHFSYYKALKVLRGECEYRVKLRLFVSRTLSIHMPKAYGDKLYQFIEIERAEDFSLKSKRQGTARVTKKKEYAFLPPKGHGTTFNPTSYPYVLDMEPVEMAYDFATNEEELLSKGLSTILLDEML